MQVGAWIENLSILMTEENEFDCFKDSCLVKAGNNIEEMLDCLVGEKDYCRTRGML